MPSCTIFLAEEGEVNQVPDVTPSDAIPFGQLLD